MVTAFPWTAALFRRFLSLGWSKKAAEKRRSPKKGKTTPENQ
jgi:hypothetical protein